MDLPLELKRVAFHYVDQKLDQPVYADQEVDLERLPPAIHAFLLDMVAEIWHAMDAGSTRSARFAAPDGPEEAAAVKSLIDALLQDEAAFFACSQRLAQLLRERSHPNASPGVLGVMSLRRLGDGKRFVALIKIRHRDQELVRLLSAGTPRLEVEQVQNVLLKDIQKGALIPHPEKPDYEVKVIDAQSRDDPAAYFTEKFLGCVSKKSDDLQVKKVVPALERFAQEKDLELAVEKLPQVIHKLKEQPEAITPQVLAETVAEEQLFGAGVEPEELIEYLDDVNLGDLDIPRDGFERKRKTGRKVVYRFTDLEFEGLEISGPPEVIAKILSASGEQVVFTLRTSRDGFKFGYQ